MNTKKCYLVKMYSKQKWNNENMEYDVLPHVNLTVKSCINNKSDVCYCNLNKVMDANISLEIDEDNG